MSYTWLERALLVDHRTALEIPETLIISCESAKNKSAQKCSWRFQGLQLWRGILQHEKI
jgi:hypothetical protein